LDFFGFGTSSAGTSCAEFLEADLGADFGADVAIFFPLLGRSSLDHY
jgi:hypothetical protein